jgi:hypothetical protein
MILEQIAAAQALVVGLLFAWAGVWKVFVAEARETALKSALSKMLPTPRLALAAHFTVGIGELAVAALLLVSPWHWFGMRVATVFTLGFLGYLTLAWRIAPARPCACMGGKTTTISRRSVLRAFSLFALTLIGWGGQEYWAGALLAAPWLVLIIALEVVLLWLLSPEFGYPGVKYERQFIRAARLRLNPACVGVTLDWDTMEAKLRNTGAFQQLAPVLSASTDRWREGCWGFLSYAASYDDHPATAIFAFPMLFDSREVSAALVDDATNATVLALPSVRGVMPPA